MPLFTVTRTRVALSTTNDLLTITAAATKPLRIYIADIKGMDQASSPNEIVLARAGTQGITGSSAITPVKVNSGSASASFTVYTAWSTQPVLGDVLWRFGVNANGGIDKFVAIPGAEISVPVAGQVCFRSVSGTSNVTINVLVEEVDG
jgi:hypothetical protein